jgi:hypothetical protein
MEPHQTVNSLVRLFLYKKLGGVMKMDLHDYKDVAENYDLYLRAIRLHSQKHNLVCEKGMIYRDK